MRLYRSAVALLLGVTALLKFVGIARHEKLLEAIDPVLNAPMHIVALVAGISEIVFALFVLLYVRQKTVLIATHILAFGFVAYHIATVVSAGRPCPCLGGGISWWPWLDEHQSQASMAIALWLWTSTLVLLATNPRAAQGS